jgi:hypothetical protein
MLYHLLFSIQYSVLLYNQSQTYARGSTLHSIPICEIGVEGYGVPCPRANRHSPLHFVGTGRDLSTNSFEQGVVELVSK